MKLFFVFIHITRIQRRIRVIETDQKSACTSDDRIRKIIDENANKRQAFEQNNIA